MSVATIKLRLRDKHASDLSRQARAINFVWNYCNETQQKAAQDRRKWLSAFDLMKLTAGAAKDLGLHSHSVQVACRQYANSRDQHRRPWLRFRGKRSLGWVPFNTGNIQARNGRLRFNGADYEPMHWRAIPEGAKIGAGTFSQDAKGHWFINMPVEMPERPMAPRSAVGIDLGLKDVACLSNGSKVANHQHFRKAETRIAKAQRAGKKALARNLMMRVTNARRDQLHKVSAEIAAQHDVIIVGNVSPSQIARTRMAKSSLDAGWAIFKNMLRYKAMRHNGVMIEVDERFTTQTCSECGSQPPERPRGIAGLGIRGWTCSACGAVHDRDVNAARNILRLGLETLAEGAAR